MFFILGGLFNEKTPLIGGFLNPLGFLGLVFPLFAYFKWQEPLTKDDPDWLREPLKTGLEKLKQTNPVDLILPWGIAGIGLFLISPIFLILAYGPLIFVQDRARIYQWISPIVCVSAAAVIPPLWLAPLVIIHFINPWRHVL